MLNTKACRTSFFSHSCQFENDPSARVSVLPNRGDIIMNALHFEHILSFFSAKKPVIGEFDTDKMDRVKPKSSAVDAEDAKMATAAEFDVDTTDDFRTNTINLFEVSEFSGRLESIKVTETDESGSGGDATFKVNVLTRLQFFSMHDTTYT
jgi:hypothetical protein